MNEKKDELQKEIDIVSKMLNVPIKVEEHLIERSFGNMEGNKNREDFNIKMMLDYKKNYNKENAEPIQTLFKRIFSFLDEIKIEYKNKKIALVTHASVSQAIECYFNGIPKECNYEYFESITLNNCEIRKYIC